jgi:hypothetical protein
MAVSPIPGTCAAAVTERPVAVSRHKDRLSMRARDALISEPVAVGGDGHHDEQQSQSCVSVGETGPEGHEDGSQPGRGRALSGT